MARSSRSADSLLNALCLSLAYTLLISLCAPFTLRRVAAAPTNRTSGGKSSPPAAAKAEEKKKGGRRDGELIIRFREGVSESDKKALVKSKGARRAKRLRGGSRLEKLETEKGRDLDALAAELRKSPLVELAEPNYLVGHDEVIPDDTRFAEQWALRNTGATGGQPGADVQAVAAWETTTGAPTTVIAVIDSGIDFTHPDLQNNQWTNAAESIDGSDNDNNGLVDDLHGWDWINGSGAVVDEQGHGTIVAGVIAAEGNNGVGTAGVMWRAGLMSLRVLDNTGTGNVADAVEAIDYAVEHEARVINCSWGTDEESLALKDAIQRAGTRGVVVVSSAGNSGRDIESAPYYPSSFGLSNQISVAATDQFDHLASWSNYGATHVTVAAPGVDILTTRMGGGYTTVSGTSASTPMIAGVAGLIKTQRWWLSAAGTRAAIIDGSRPVAELTGKVAAGGVVSAAGALAAMLDPGPELTPTPTPTPGGGTSGTSEDTPGPNLPDLDEARDTEPTDPVAPSPIRADLCPECDPNEGDPPPASGADPYFATARTRPQNETGERGVDLGSRNFSWGTTLVNLPGRAGMGLDLGISYNSLVWTKQGTAMMFNADRGNPTPGFRLGLPTLESEHVNEDDVISTYLLVLPSGARVALKKVSATATGATYESQDGSYIQLIVTYGAATPHVARTPDGTQYQFGQVVGGYGLNCTRVQDRNGNYISIQYASGKVSSMLDTLGRAVNFNYDPVDGRLSSITQNRGGAVYTWATFGYGTLPISTWWSGLSYLGPQGSIPVLTQIGLSDGTRYNFEYTTWGQVWKIRNHAQNGDLLSYTSYNLPQTASSGHTDCPRFTERREWAQDWNGDADGNPAPAEEAVTYYSVDPNSAGGEQPAWTQVTTPDGTVYKEFFDTSATWKTGLTTSTEVWADPNPLDSDNTKVKVKWTATEWTQDSTTLTYQKNPRPTVNTVFDSAGNGRREKYTYTGVSAFSLPSYVDEYEVVGATETPLRRTQSTYNLTTPYRNNRIIGLVLSRIVYSDVTTDANKIVSKVDYQYDEGGGWFKDAGVALTNHDTAFDGAATYGGRGNLTSVRRWDASDYANSAKLVESNIGYDNAGSVVLTRDPLGRTTNVDFADSFSTTVGVTTRAYPTKVTPPLTTAEQANDDDFATTTQYNYDTGAVMKTTRPVNNTGGTAGDSVTFADVNYLYDTAGRLARITNAANGAYTRWVYPTSNTLIQQYQTVHSTAEVYTTELLDGAGRVRGASAEHPGSAGLYSGQYVVYDAMGRAVKQSNPTEMTGAWAATGDDAAAGWKYTLQSYDWQGRPLVMTHVDGTTRTNSYGGCGCAGGEQLTSTDERGRKKVLKKDSFSRLKTVEEYTFAGAVYSTTAYTYDALDHLVGINQAGQTRTFIYDGHGRLLTRTTPEQGTSTYAYNKDDTVQKVTDARGASITFVYNYRRQPTSVTYAAPTNVPGLAPTPNVTYEYDSAGNRTSMTDGQGTATYHYNSVSQMDWEERTFAGLTGDYKLAYLYNKSGDVTKVTASGPGSFGAAVAVNYVRDKTGRPTSVTGSGYAGVTSYVTGISYRAFGSPKQITYSTGNALALEYDTDLRLTKWDVAGAAFGWDYKYSTPGLQEKTGRVTFADNLYDSTLDRSYSYDDLGRLAGAHSGSEASGHAGYTSWSPGMTPTGPYAENFAYDQRGNMTWRNGWGAPNAQYAHNPQPNAKNQTTVNPVTGAAMMYDAAGNLLSDGATSYTYDATGQQITAGGTALVQAYDGDGLRIKKTESELTTTYYVRSSVLGNQVVAEIGGSAPYVGKMTRGYVYLGGQLLAVQEGREDSNKPDRVLWVHQDPVTKSQRLTDSAGAVVSTVDLDPWGGETGRSEFQTQQPRRYTTYERDENGGDEAMFRRYESKASRFSQPDPYDGSYNLTDPQSLNRYSYTQNDPVNFTDPTGLMCYNIVRTDYYSDNFQILGSYVVGTICDGWSGYKAPLKDDKLKKFIKERAKTLKKLKKSKKCRDFLIAHGIDPDAAYDAVSMQRAFDGAESTLTRLEAGLVSPNVNLSKRPGSDYAYASVNVEFTNSGRRKIQAHTAFYVGGQFNTTVAGRSDVYYRESGIKASNILHEALHSLLGLFDPQLAQRLGTTVTQQDTDNISKALHDHDCGG